MSLLKFIDRLTRIDWMIRREATGPSEEFARKLGISRSMLMENLREMKELGAEVCYCAHRRTYYYKNTFELIIGSTSRGQTKGGLMRTSNAMDGAFPVGSIRHIVSKPTFARSPFDVDLLDRMLKEVSAEMRGTASWKD